MEEASPVLKVKFPDMASDRVDPVAIRTDPVAPLVAFAEPRKTEPDEGPFPDTT